jgi:protein phosphatase
VGLVRKMNEDAFLDQAERGLWAVADGMGGHALGAFASGKVIQVLSGTTCPGDIESYTDVVRQRLQEANRELRLASAARGLNTIGSTVAVLLAHERHCGYLWAGDSRIYRYRNQRLTQLTRDHNVAQDLKAKGQTLPDELARHPSHSAVTRAVGAEDMLELDAEMADVRDGDIFLLCSDGLSNAVTGQDICDALLPGNCRQAAETLLAIALQRGGRDNISAVVVRADDPDALDRTLYNPSV